MSQVVDPIVINVDEFTNNVTTDDVQWTVSGDGIFDKLMDTATKHLKAQFNASRIREEDYATAYIQIYQSTLQAALQVWLQKGIAEKQLELLAAQVSSEESKRDLYRRQIEGFDEDYKNKMFKIMLDGWTVALSVAKEEVMANNFPAPVTTTAINDVFNNYILTEFDDYNYGRPILDEPTP